MYESNVCTAMVYDFYHDVMRLDTSTDEVIRMRKFFNDVWNDLNYF